MLLFLLPLLASAAPSSGTDHGEYRRISEDMHRMAKAGNWLAVERSFLRLEKLGSPHTVKVLLDAAYSARERGDMTVARQRLHQASRIGENPKVAAWLWDIEKQYAPVTVAADLLDNYRLVPEAMPFSPEHRRVVQVAMERVRQDGYFSGLLPKGAYRFEPYVNGEGRVYRFDLNTDRSSIDLRTKDEPTGRDRRRRARLDRRLEKARP